MLPANSVCPCFVWFDWGNLTTGQFGFPGKSSTVINKEICSEWGVVQILVEEAYPRF